MYLINLDREDDGRWIAEIPGLPGTMVYSDTRQGAIRAVGVLAYRVIADKLEHGELRVSSIRRRKISKTSRSKMPRRRGMKKVGTSRRLDLSSLVEA